MRQGPSYTQLISTGYDTTPLGFFEYEWVKASGSTTMIDEELKMGYDILKNHEEEVQKTYGHLAVRYFDLVKVFEYESLDPDGGTTGLKRHLREAGMSLDLTKQRR